MAEPLLATEGLIKRFGGLVATDNLSLGVLPGEIHALIGPNGAGKTTVVAQLSGLLAPTAGRILFGGHDITRLPMPARSLAGIARSFQITSVLRDFTTLDNVALAVQAHQGHSFRFWRDARSDSSMRDPARKVLDDLGLGSRNPRFELAVIEPHEQIADHDLVVDGCKHFGNPARRLRGHTNFTATGLHASRRGSGPLDRGQRGRGLSGHGPGLTGGGHVDRRAASELRPEMARHVVGDGERERGRDQKRVESRVASEHGYFRFF